MKNQDKSKPWMYANYDKVLLGSIQALARGEADEYAQKRFLKWLIE